MRKTLALLGVLALALTIPHAAAAGDKGCSKPCAGAAKSTPADNAADSVVKTVGAQTPTCHRAAAKAAYESTLAATGCERSAHEASKKAMAETAYANALAETSCAKTAQRAAHDAVLAETGCEKSAAWASRHAAAKVEYDSTLARTSCEKTAEAAYQQAMSESSADHAEQSETSS